MNLNV
jgi:hypothetical protein